MPKAILMTSYKGPNKDNANFFIHNFGSYNTLVTNF